jgi:hypothetical protein
MAETLNAQIRAWCEARGYVFKPWEIPPWKANSGPSPWPEGSGGFEFWPKAQKLRRKIIAELKRAADAGA